MRATGNPEGPELPTVAPSFLGTAALPVLGMGHDACADDAGVGLDLCEKEQSALARRYVLTQTLDTSEPWSHAGPRSVSPFAPCASSRVPHILAAARLDEDSVLWDLGCGDGRVLHEAAARYGCRCVGVEIDAPCLAESARRAEAMGRAVAETCSWHLLDVTALPRGSLGTDDAIAADTPAPTVVLLFITGHGLCALSPWLKREWETASRPFAIITCVEALDACADVAALGADAAARGGNPLFDLDANPHDWAVYRDPTHATYGVFVTPPRGVSLEAWANAKPVPAPADPAAAARLGFSVARGALDEADARAIEALVERLEPGFFGSDGDRSETAEVTAERSETTRERVASDDDALAARLGAALLETGETDETDGETATGSRASFWSEAEDACHAHRSHRVVHLHARADDELEDAFSKHAPRARAKLLRAAYDCDADARMRMTSDATNDADAASKKSRGGETVLLTRGRALFVRSAEYHAYEPGGGVTDPSHRDTGSVLTVSVVLESPSLCERRKERESASAHSAASSGGAFFFHDEASSDADPLASLRRGDAVVFPSEKRHGVTPLVGEGARRRSVVLELWEGGVTRKNRQE